MSQSQFSRNNYARVDRVAEQVRRELAQLIRERVKDPRVGMVSILDVKVAKDFAHARIWFDMLQADHALEVEAALNHAAGFLRRELGRQMKLRVIPELHFIYDDTQLRGNALSALIDKAVAADAAEHNESIDDESADDEGDSDSTASDSTAQH